MSEITCEIIIENRAKEGKPTLSGRRAGAYHMVGGLGCVATTVCDRHAKAITKAGYRFIPLDVARPEPKPKALSVANNGESEVESVPLLTNGQNAVSELNHDGKSFQIHAVAGPSKSNDNNDQTSWPLSRACS